MDFVESLEGTIHLNVSVKGDFLPEVTVDEVVCKSWSCESDAEI